MDIVFALFEVFTLLFITFVLAVLALSMFTWDSSKSLIDPNHWVLEIVKVTTKHGITYLVYNHENDEFLVQVSKVEDLVPWVTEQLKKNTNRSISILDPSGVPRALTLIKQ